MRQRTLAASLGVRSETVANWELGRTAPLPRHYRAIVGFLGYDPGPAGDDLPGRLHATRRRLGLTHAELAAQLDLDEATIRDAEHGRRRLARRTTDRLALLTDVQGEGLNEDTH